MKLPKCLLCIIFCTVVALVYIQLQVQIYDLAYRGKNKQEQIQQLKDENSDVIYHICTLKSANHLGVKVLTENSGMQFLDDTRIVLVESPQEPVSAQTLALSSNRRLGFLASIFSLKSQAEARTIK